MNRYNSISNMNNDVSTINDDVSTINDDVSTINDCSTTLNDDASSIKSEATYNSLRSLKIQEYIKLLKYKKYLRSTRKSRPMLLTNSNARINTNYVPYYNHNRLNNNFHINLRKTRLNRSRFMNRSNIGTRKNTWSR